jgi:hypothetical protein
MRHRHTITSMYIYLEPDSPTMAADTPLPTMHVVPPKTRPIPTRPQFHCRKYHDSYNGARHLPTTVCVRSPTLRVTTFGGDSGCFVGQDKELLYEIQLYYAHNRACAIYRSLDDFSRLRAGLSPWAEAPPIQPEMPVEDLRRFLQAALERPGAPGAALEYFLRRRMDDCSGP